jgi:trehalose 6-phosphate phosphatase
MTNRPALESQPPSPPQPPRQPPDLRSDWALFLDFDGTLLDLAPTPTSVVVPDGLVDVLRRLQDRLHGAVAIVTGRPLADIDRLLAPLVLPVAGNHGASARLPDGTQQVLAPVTPLPGDWVTRAQAACAHWPGTIVEPKPYSLALHYRLAPDRGRDLFDLLSRFAGERPDDYEILKAHHAYELRPRHADKGLAIERLMALAPFQGRVPVFIGDDVTDESGWAAARRLGGIGLDVGQSFDGSAARVRQWLTKAVGNKET